MVQKKKLKEFLYKNYTAVDGLCILRDLGLMDLTLSEIREFIDSWDPIYEDSCCDPIKTTWTLYAVALPGAIKNDYFSAVNVYARRSHDFQTKLVEHFNEKTIKSGLSKKEISDIIDSCDPLGDVSSLS